MAKQGTRRISEMKQKSVHAGVGSVTSYVNVRHPEGRVHIPPSEDAIGTPNMLSQDIEPQNISLDQPCNPFADMKCYLLDGFSRSVTGGTFSNAPDGGAWASTGRYQTLQTDGSPFQLYEVPWSRSVWSSLGTQAYAWTHNPGLGCTGLSFTMTGWMEKESWQTYTVPAAATDSAGVTIGPYTFMAPTGLAGGVVGQAQGANLVVRTSAPTAMRQGTFVANLPHNVATTAFIPAALLPAEGETLWVGIQPNWIADYGGYTCGFRWPWMDGKGNSAKGYVNGTISLTWQAWDAGEDDWGAAASDTDTGAWWEGGLPWRVSATGGSYGYDGNHLFLTVPAGSQQNLTATMYGTSSTEVADDYDEAMGEPWSLENGVAMRARFKLTTAGAVAEAGARYLRFRWHDGKDELTAEVRLGDMEYAQGLRVSDGDGASDFTAKDITEGAYMWVELDSRNPAYLKGTLWAESGPYGGGQPAKHDVVVARTQDAEAPSTGDYFQVAISAGNMTGANQTVQVDAVYFCGSGSDCEWVEEYMGQGDGTTYVFETAQPFKPSSLWWFVDGFHVNPDVIDYERGQFSAPLSIPAATSANLVARYRVDLNPTGD